MTIDSLNKHDVILGRGSTRNFVGNKSFHRLVDERREEYLAAKNKQKRQISLDIVNHIHSMGGRFVKQLKFGRKEGELYVDGEWEEVTNISVAIEKTKQALREHVLRGRPPEQQEKDEANKKQDNEKPAVATGDISSSDVPVANEEEVSKRRIGKLVSTSTPPLSNDERVPSPKNVMSVPRVFVVGAKMSHPPAAPCLLHNTPTAVDSRLSLLESIVLGQTNDGFPRVTPKTVSPLPHASDRIPSNIRKHRMDEDRLDATVETTKMKPKLAQTPSYSARSRDEEAAAFVLASLAVKDRPVFKDEDLARERASLTNEQREEALADTFGKMYVSDRQSKKQKFDRLDKESREFLIQQMMLEIENAPFAEKEALMEARIKARPQEFSDFRLEQFLTCEGFNPELAAKRFITYWRERKGLFGPDKFTMRLSLSEALKDDRAALESGVYTLLPFRDLSGRHLVVGEPSKNTGQGYSSDSLLRAFWYLIEVAAASEDSDDVGCRVVHLAWLKGMTLFDYDPNLQDRVVVYYRSVWPVKCMSIHSCCPSGILVRVIAPVLRPLADQWMRARSQVHAVPETEISHALSEYGIERYMLPIEMGGTLELSPSGFVSHRRAAEMESEELS